MAGIRNKISGEIWKPVPGYEGHYEVSNLGRIWSVPRPHPATKTGCLVTPMLDLYGYPRIFIDRKAKRVHRLVLLAFRGPAPQGHVGAHLNGNPADSRLENLAWVTITENMGHKKLHGTHRTGVKHPGAKLSEAQVCELRQLRHKRWKTSDLGERYGISQNTAYNVGCGTSYADLNDKYPPFIGNVRHRERGAEVDCDKPSKAQ